MANREYKSDVFSMLLEDRARALDVYNAMAGTAYTNPEIIEIHTLESVYRLRCTTMHRLCKHGFGSEYLRTSVNVQPEHATSGTDLFCDDHQETDRKQIFT